VVVEDPDRVRFEGEPVAGRVEVEVDEDVTCSGVFCVLRWRTTGDANTAAKDSPSVNVGGGTWKGGDRFSFPFSIPVPAGPPTYDGRRFGVHWIVHAEAKLDWAIDPSVAAPIRVGPLPVGEGSLVDKTESGGFEVGCAMTCTVILLSCLSVLFMSRGFPGVGWVIGAGVAGLGALVMIPNAFARWRLGETLVECGPSPVAAGEELAVRILVHPKADITPKKVSVVLVGVERSEKGSGKSRKTRSEELGKVEATLEGPSVLEAGHKAEWAGIVRVPGDAAPSFTAGPHSVTWIVKFAIDQDWLPEAEWSVAIRVV
jgi:hypothetical protein